VHSPQSSAIGPTGPQNVNNAAKQILPIDPTADLADYRIDWTPGKVEFYVNNGLARTMVTNIPADGGRIFVNHWSNGDPGWSGAPPETDAVMWVKSYRSYFNSSDAAKARQLDDQCAAAMKRGKVDLCQIGTASAPVAPVNPQKPPGGRSGGPSLQSGGKGGTSSEAWSVRRCQDGGGLWHVGLGLFAVAAALRLTL
jgi:hypothetical protein